MAKIDESELGDDFRYILRLAMSDVDGMKPIGLGLTSINGVGKRTATALCEIASVDNKKLGGHLTDDELTQKIPTNFTVTKGSSSGGNNPTVVFKPLR